jgi:hypothetical protein
MYLAPKLLPRLIPKLFGKACTLAPLAYSLYFCIHL